MPGTINSSAASLYDQDTGLRVGYLNPVTGKEVLDADARVVQTRALTVATLPTAVSSNGARAFVTNSLTPTFGAIVTGGGAVAIPVYSDGTNWRVG